MDPPELRTPDLAPLLQVGHRESRARLPHPPGHSSSDEAQDTVDPPGCKDLSVCQVEQVAVMNFEVQETWFLSGSLFFYRSFGFYQ